MLFKEPSRPFDPTASSELNFIQSERREINEENEGLFVPSLGPYYADTLVVRYGAEVLVRNVDYFCYVLHGRASKATAKPVACCVKVVKYGVANVDIDYQVVGGEYESVFDVFKELLDDNAGGISTPIYYKDIIDLPKTFNPASHMHPHWELTDWAGWITPLDKIKQGILFRKSAKVKSVYDYLDEKIKSFETNLNNKLASLSSNLDTVRKSTVEPVNTLIIRADKTNPTTLRDGTWTDVKDQVLMVGTSETVGTTATLSEDIVYPQPDNILFDDEGIPITRDDGEWMYLDNKHPVKSGEDSDYGKPYDTQFSLFSLKGWVKQAVGADTSQTLTATPTTIVEGGTTTFTLTTTGYDAGMKFPYRLTQVGSENVNVPLSGYLTIDASGKATLPVKLIAGSPRTDFSSMVLTVLTIKVLTKSVNYTLSTNTLYEAKTYMTTGRNTIKLDQLTVGDQFFIVIRTAGLKGKTIHVKLAGDKGTHTYVPTGYTADGTNGYKVTVNDEGEDLYIPVQSTQKDAVAPGNLNVTVLYNGVTLDTFKVPAVLLAFKAVWKRIETLKEVTTVTDGERFVLDVTHNSRQSLIYNIATVSNPVAGQMLSVVPSLVYVAGLTFGRSSFMEVSRTNKTTTDVIKIRIFSTLLSTQYIEKSITITPQVSE